MMTVYEFEVAGRKYSCVAAEKYTAYAAMLLRHNNVPHLVLVTAPADCVDDVWMSLDGSFRFKLDEVFGGTGRFIEYFRTHKPQIMLCYNGVKEVHGPNESED